MNKPHRVFLDMDGVIADFIAGVAHWFSLTINPETRDGPLQKVLDLSPAQERAVLRAISHSQQFWEEIPIFPWTEFILNEVVRLDPDFCILTTPTGPASCAGKVVWLQRLFGIPQERVIFTHQKSLLARDDRLLIDDTISNVTEWGARGPALFWPQLHPHVARLELDVHKGRLNHQISILLES